MKQISSKTKISIVIITIIIVAGIAMMFIKGINKSIPYSDHTRLEITLNNLEKQKVEEIAKETLGENIIVQTFGDFEDKIAISMNKLEEDKKTQFQDKLNELNEGENVDITETEVGKTKLKDMMTPYVLPIAIITVLFALYKGLKYRKDGFIKMFITPIFDVVVAEAVYISLYAILRIPVGIYFMPLFASVGIITLIANLICKSNSSKKQEKKEKNN